MVSHNLSLTNRQRFGISQARKAEKIKTMTLFLSTYTNKMDKKNRLSVPASFRTALPKTSAETIVLIPSFRHACLEGFSYEQLEHLSAGIDHFDLFSDDQDDLASALFGQAISLSFDETGRIVLPKSLIDHAGINDQASFVGLGKMFQIWNPDQLAKRQAKAIEGIRQRGLTIPARSTQAGEQ